MILNEMRFTCMVAMTFAFLLLVLVLPSYVRTYRPLKISQRLLAVGIGIATLHFSLMYFLPDDRQPVAEVRMVINLMCCIPMTHFIFLSYYFLQRKGKPVALTLWLAPCLFGIQAVLLTLGYLLVPGPLLPGWVLPVLSAICTLMLCYAAAVMIKEYWTIERSVRYKSDLSLYSLQTWTRYTMLTMIGIYMGLPFMTYAQSSVARVVYSLIFIAVTSMYVLSFISYVFHYKAMPERKEKEKRKPNYGWIWLTHPGVFKLGGMSASTGALRGLRYDPSQELESELHTAGPGFPLTLKKKQQRKLKDNQRSRIETAITRFVESGEFTHFHIKKKDVVLSMGLTMTEFDQWLVASGHQKFNSWLMYLRIEHAKKLLQLHPELTNDGIAERCGFCNRQYFQLQFTKYTGTSPSKWEKKDEEERV